MASKPSSEEGPPTKGEAALRLLREPSDNHQANALRSTLTSLDLKDVGLTDLPSGLAQCCVLEKLDIGSNKSLRTVPEVVASLPELRILFASNIGMTEIPECLAVCPKLRMLGIKDNFLKTLNGNSLPTSLVWLIAASNQIEALPNVGRLKHVRKLMLSNNRLTAESLVPVAEIEDLEMLRAAANCLESFPDELLRHRRLAWVAIGSNPLTEAAMEKLLASTPATLERDFAEVQRGETLGTGAGGAVYKATWRGQAGALKLWEGVHFSDGTAQGEWSANRLAGDPGHASLVRVHGVFKDPLGMMMELLENSEKAASPPSFATVTRDNLRSLGGTGPTYTPQSAVSVANAVAQACAYLRDKGLHHGDVYLHNTLVVVDDPSPDGSRRGVSVKDVRLSDFGAAAAALPPLLGALEKLEVRSFGWLLQDLLESLEGVAVAASGGGDANAEILQELSKLRSRCGGEVVDEIPTFKEIAMVLGKLLLPSPAAPTPASTL